MRGQALDGELKTLNQGNEVLLLTIFLLNLELVCVELLNTEILVFDLICLLLTELCDHVIDGLLRFCEGIKIAPCFPPGRKQG